MLSQNACAVVSLDEQHAASMSLLQFEHDYTGGFFDDCMYTFELLRLMLIDGKRYSKWSMQLLLSNTQ